MLCTRMMKHRIILILVPLLALLLYFIGRSSPSSVKNYLYTRILKSESGYDSQIIRNYSYTRILKRESGNDSKVIRIGILIPYINLVNISLSKLPSLFPTTDHAYRYRVYIGITDDSRQNDVLKSLNSEYANIRVIRASTSFYSDIVSELANIAGDDGIHYFVSIGYGTVFTNKHWLTEALQSLNGHCPSGIGAVMHHCYENNTVTVVHKRHLETFGYHYPSECNFEAAIDWLTWVYQPIYTSVVAVNEHTRCPVMINATSHTHHTSDRERVQHNAKNVNKRDMACVVSYSLYGSANRYVAGALENSDLVQTIYAGWVIWLYHDNTVPASVLLDLCERNHVKCINMTNSGIANKRAWRFLVASGINVSRYIVRDIDSRLSVREQSAVFEWIQSGKLFHVMRDHPSHYHTINAGMWGGTQDAYPNMEAIMHQSHTRNTFTDDTRFLNRTVWPEAKKSVLQHDSFYCDKYDSKPFPTARVGWEHIGSVYINGNMRVGDVNVLRKHKDSDNCGLHSNA